MEKKESHNKLYEKENIKLEQKWISKFSIVI